MIHDVVVAIAQDTTTVELEGKARSSNADSDRTLLACRSNKSGVVIGW
jgi:hypothetical protein